MKALLRLLVLISLVTTLACEQQEEDQVQPPKTSGGKQGGQNPGSGGGTGGTGGNDAESSSPNTKPVVQGASFVLKQGVEVSVVPQGLDADGDTLTYSIGTSPSHGTLSLIGGRFSYTAESNYVGLDQFTYSASDSKESSDPATVKLFIMNGQAEKAFWLKPEDIQPAGTDGDMIVDWKDAVSGASAHFEDAARTPRYISEIAPGVPGIKFEFNAGDGAGNDFMSYPGTYAYVSSADGGFTFIAVAESLSFSNDTAPLLSFGKWMDEAFGFTWSSTHVGTVTPTAHGGADYKDLLSLTGGGLGLFSSQTRFSNPGQNNGFQRVRLNGGGWTNTDTTLGLTQLTSHEISAQAALSAAGSPIVIGANSDFASQADHRFSGKVGEIILINRFLSTTELNVVEAYLKTKFHLP
jgi:hypothetical protein